MKPIDQNRTRAFVEIVRNTARVAALIWPHRRRLVLAHAVILIAVSVIPFAENGLLGLLVNELVHVFGGGVFTKALLLVVTGFAVLSATAALLAIAQGYVDRLLWFFTQEHIEFVMLKQRGRLDVGTHEDPQQSDLYIRAYENQYRIHQFFDRQFFIAQNVLEFTIAAAILSVAEWWVALIVLLGVLPSLLIDLRYGEGVWNIYGGHAETRRRFFDLRQHFVDLPQLVELKLFQNVPHFLKIMTGYFRTLQTKQKDEERQRARGHIFALIASQAVFTVVVVWFVRAVVVGEFEPGTLLFLLGVVGQFRRAVGGLFLNLAKQYEDNLFVSDFFRWLALESKVAMPQCGVSLPQKKTPEIVFEDVSFSYPGATKPVLEHFSLVIAPGEKIALIGANGAGKTTVVKLLCRFYDPTFGRILLGGQELREVELESWYNMLGVLFQDYAHYHFLAREAISIGRTNGVGVALSDRASALRVQRSGETSGSHEFITQWGKQYEQMLGKEFAGGVEPSIGQWQKLALARTFYRDPRVLILDEPTSSVDAEAEEKIFAELERTSTDRTMILISHRFSTVRRADRICVIEGGTVHELGTHDELLAQSGTYARLFALQARGYA